MLYMCACELACAYHAALIACTSASVWVLCAFVYVRTCMHVRYKYVSMAYPLFNVNVS
jgi:hypothetical protein